MATFQLDMRQFARDLERRVKEIPKEIKKGVVEGARKGKRTLQAANPRDTSKMADDWSVDVDEGEKIAVTIKNDAPYAGIVEVGARPHGVNAEGLESIRQWAIRKLGVTQEEAEQVAWAVAAKLKARGQKPTYFVKNNLENITKETAVEVKHKLIQLANRRAK